MQLFLCHIYMIPFLLKVPSAVSPSCRLALLLSLIFLLLVILVSLNGRMPWRSKSRYSGRPSSVIREFFVVCITIADSVPRHRVHKEALQNQNPGPELSSPNATPHADQEQRLVFSSGIHWYTNIPVSKK